MNDNTQWVNSHIVEISEKNPRNYNGEIVDERIVLNMELGQRIFIKIKDM